MPSSISKSAIERIAHLARLGIDIEDGHSSIQKDLNNIVAMVDQISTANTKGVLPMNHPLDKSQRLRPDSATEPDQRQALLKIAPLVEADLFLVPKVIE